MGSNRREFFKTATAALTAAPLFIPRSAWGANDRIAYGVIGTAGRGRYRNDKFQKLGAQCVALCDVYEPNLEAARKQSPDARPYGDYHELLHHKEMDAVVIASPDHHHCPMLLEALDAKK